MGEAISLHTRQYSQSPKFPKYYRCYILIFPRVPRLVPGTVYKDLRDYSTCPSHAIIFRNTPSGNPTIPRRTILRDHRCSYFVRCDKLYRVHLTAVYPVQRVCLSQSSISLHHRYCCLPDTTFRQVSYLLDAYVHHTAVFPVQRVFVCHNPVYYYITATAVYLTQRFITTCVDDIYRMNSHCVYYVYCKWTSTR